MEQQIREAVRAALEEEQARLNRQLTSLQEKVKGVDFSDDDRPAYQMFGKIQGVKLAIENLRQSLLNYQNETGA